MQRRPRAKEQPVQVNDVGSSKSIAELRIVNPQTIIDDAIAINHCMIGNSTVGRIQNASGGAIDKLDPCANCSTEFANA
jgi:hypothetical protein